MTEKKPMQRFDPVRGGIDDSTASRVYTGPERRAEPPFSAEEHQRICSQNQQELARALEEVNRAIHELSRLVKAGFPNDDPHGHRRVHEGYIEEAEARKKLKAAVLEKTLSGVLWTGMAGLGMALWETVKAAVHK